MATGASIARRKASSLIPVTTVVVPSITTMLVLSWSRYGYLWAGYGGCRVHGGLGVADTGGV